MTTDEGGSTTGRTRADSMRRGLELLWEGLPEGGRGPKRTLTLEQIVEAAVAAADESGIDAMSMRSIARRLDVGTMTLYRYVPDKATLIDLVLDHLIASTEHWSTGELPGDGPSWRRALTLSAHEGRAIYLAHPWLIQLNRWSRPSFGPNTITSMEKLVANMHDLPISDRERINLIVSVDALVTGSVRAQLLHLRAPDDTGMDDEEYWSIQTPVLEGAMASGDYPAMAELDEDAFEGGWDEVFELAVETFLDGVAVRFTMPEDRG